MLCPFATEHRPADRTRFVDQLNGVLGGILTPESWTLSQSYYFGNVDGKQPIELEIVPGTRLDMCFGLDAGAIGKGKKETGTRTDTHEGRDAPTDLVESDDDSQLLSRGEGLVNRYLDKYTGGFSATGMGVYRIVNLLRDMRTPDGATPSETMIRNLLAAHWPDIADATFKNAEKYRENGPGCDIVGYSVKLGKAAEAIEELAKEPVDDGGPVQINTAAAYDNHRVTAKWTTYADDEGDDADDTLAELAPRWIEKHVVTYLEGPGGLGKSMIALQDAACIAAGYDILGETAERTGVLYLNYEEKEVEFKRRLKRIRRHFGIAKGGDFQALHLKNEPAAHLLRVTKDGAIILTRFGREFHAKLAERRDRGLHTFVVFDGIIDAILFDGSTRVDDTIARQVIALLDRWCEEFDFSAYAILHPSRAAERQGGGSYAPAWSTKPRVIHTFARVTFDGKAAKKKDTPRSHCFTRRLVAKRSHGEDQYHVDMCFRDDCFEPLPVHATGGGEDPVDVAVDLACRQVAAGRVKRDGTVGKLKITNGHALITNYRRRTGQMVGVDHFLGSLADAHQARKIHYHDATRNSRQPAGYYPVDGWEPIEEDGIPYAVDLA